MNDQVIGAVVRAARVRLGWRQVDLEARSRVPVRMISRAERGQVTYLTIGQLRALGGPLGISFDVAARSRFGDLDRLIRAGHSQLHDELSRLFRELPGWVAEHEVSFSIYGERGVIDIIGIRAGAPCLSSTSRP